MGPRLEGHWPGLSAIQTPPSCRSHTAVDFPGLRRGGSSPQIIDQAQDFPERVPRHGNLGQLERDVSTLTSFSRSVVGDQCSTSFGKASDRMKLARL